MTNAAAPLPALIVSQSPSATALTLALRLVAGQSDAATLAWVRAGLLRWLKSDGAASLSECLHLSDSPRRVRLAMRDTWIADAAGYIDGSMWNKAKVLHAEARHFERCRWPTWRKYETPPFDAGTPIELCLHGAMLAYPLLPATVEGLHAVITKHLTGTR